MTKPRAIILLACTISGSGSERYYLHLKQALLITSSGNWTVYMNNTIEIHLHARLPALRAHIFHTATWHLHSNVGLRVLQLPVVILADQWHSVASKHGGRSDSPTIPRELL